MFNKEMKMEEKTRNQAFEMVRQHGYNQALILAKQARDNNSPGTFTFAWNNQVVKHMELFATAGHISMFRTTV
jgi:DNA-binding LacI/PurR family transcriptional regulator